MKKMIWGVLAAGLLTSTVAVAHQGGEHLMGTVQSFEAPSLVVKTKEGKAVTIHVDKATRYEKSGAAASASDLKPGERVVVHAMEHGTMLHGTLVKWGKSPAGKGAAPASPQGGPKGRSSADAGHDHAGH